MLYMALFLQALAVAFVSILSIYHFINHIQYCFPQGYAHIGDI